MEVSYLAEASAELTESAKFYEDRVGGLGQRFLDAVDDAVAFLERHSDIWPPDAHGRRKQPVRGFPFLLIYKISADRLYVLAIAHTSRRPGYWHNRD